MQFFIPTVTDPRAAELLCRHIVADIEDCAGWNVTEERVFSLEYQDGDEVKSVSVGGTVQGETIHCILATEHVFLLVSLLGVSRLGMPTIVDKRNVLNVKWFEGHSPSRLLASDESNEVEMPSGTVAFLFTDVEGSTRLWEKEPALMHDALARHDWLIGEAVASNGGYVFKTVGDSLCAAFPTTPGALRASLEAQLDLDSEPWPDGIEMKVRMAIHAGDAFIRNGDYFGKPLSLVARLLSMAHGGQVLMSEAAKILARDALPSHTHMKLLGEFNLRGIGRPEMIYQLCHPYVRMDFSPLKSHLPHQYAPFLKVA